MPLTGGTALLDGDARSGAVLLAWSGALSPFFDATTSGCLASVALISVSSDRSSLPSGALLSGGSWETEFCGGVGGASRLGCAAANRRQPIGAGSFRGPRSPQGRYFDFKAVRFGGRQSMSRSNFAARCSVDCIWRKLPGALQYTSRPCHVSLAGDVAGNTVDIDGTRRIQRVRLGSA